MGIRKGNNGDLIKGTEREGKKGGWRERGRSKRREGDALHLLPSDYTGGGKADVPSPSFSWYQCNGLCICFHQAT